MRFRPLHDRLVVRRIDADRIHQLFDVVIHLDSSEGLMCDGELTQHGPCR